MFGFGEFIVFALKTIIVGIIVIICLSHLTCSKSRKLETAQTVNDSLRHEILKRDSIIFRLNLEKEFSGKH